MRYTTLEKLLEMNTLHTFLVDAAGVLYTNAGTVPGSNKAVEAMKSRGNVFVLTNNTTLYVNELSQKLATHNIHIQPSHIISSGLGLKYDNQINALIKNKAAYVFGRSGSENYVVDAGCSKIVDDVAKAEVVVILSTKKENNEQAVEDLIQTLKANPPIPLICGNPDFYIMGIDGKRIPVIGYYCQKISEALNQPIHWVGKPKDNFTAVVGDLLMNQFNIKLDKGVCFFDDNCENLMKISRFLKISNCCVHETGLSQDIDFNKEELTLDQLPDFIIPQLSM
ncbi:hypothetical protein ACFL96_00770 [Thermoproteota archaeon]